MPTYLIAQLKEHCTDIAKFIGLNPVWSLNFPGFPFVTFPLTFVITMIFNPKLHLLSSVRISSIRITWHTLSFLTSRAFSFVSRLKSRSSFEFPWRRPFWLRVHVLALCFSSVPLLCSFFLFCGVTLSPKVTFDFLSPAAVNFPAPWKTGRPFWIWRKQLTTSTRVALFLSSWLIKPWSRGTGIE